MTIEEIAISIVNKKYSGWDFELKRWAIECCEEAATEQDHIARQEEREKCIKVAVEVYADLLSAKGYDIGSINSEAQRLRKAIEENSSKNY